MRGRTAHVEILNRSSILRPPRHWAQEKKLFQRKLALEDVALAQSPLALEIEWGDYLLLDDDVLQIGRVLGNRIHDGIAEGFLLGIPVQPGSEFVGRVLNEARHHVLARWRDGRIGE